MAVEFNIKEFSILNYIDRNSDATQRELSEHIGVSLGTINILLKRMVKKGLVKIERLQPNSVKYFLTPAGIADKIERTYGYIVRTYRELGWFRSRIITILSSVITEETKDHILFFGKQDDFYSLITEILHDEYQLTNNQIFSTKESLEKALNKVSNPTVITWDGKAEKLLVSSDIKNINILNKIMVL
ncbi:MAG: winged helix-turn-helix transcriptional regulator [Sphaerochaeta sp.]